MTSSGASTSLPSTCRSINRSAQCGFSFDVVGNLISEDDQKRKLDVIVETARQICG